MHFWLLDVKSTVIVNGRDVAFDYVNTYFERNDAIEEARLLSADENVLEVSVHHWVLKDDGAQEHVESNDWREEIPYRFINMNHREFKEVNHGTL